MDVVVLHRARLYYIILFIFCKYFVLAKNNTVFLTKFTKAKLLPPCSWLFQIYIEKIF